MMIEPRTKHIFFHSDTSSSVYLLHSLPQWLSNITTFTRLAYRIHLHLPAVNHSDKAKPCFFAVSPSQILQTVHQQTLNTHQLIVCFGVFWMSNSGWYIVPKTMLNSRKRTFQELFSTNPLLITIRQRNLQTDFWSIFLWQSDSIL